ncbi:EVE domain-containing protein [uncultured Paludibaculum sp.]|uniref:EVE domain-containing protein n=1 Tax=uncultured Paludibaculum sp. TaxID=1765020 RepID=UPI002AAAB4A3|nr:EVE domain-containing protein [uncultured Paludibaculum sp.]
MAYFLAKTDPDTYPIEQFKADGRTTWDGVTNAQAVAAIRTMGTGDRVFIYHSGGQSQILGLAEVTSAPRQDPKQPKSWVVDMRFVEDLLPPTSLSEIKASGLFNDWALVRQSRLSTMAAPASFVDWMKARYPKAKL